MAVVLFPLWPYELKYFLFKFCLYLTVLILGVSAVRLVLYVVGGVFGVSFWLWPNLYQLETTMESLKPFYSIEKWEGSSKETTIVRVVLLMLVMYYGYHIVNDPGMIKGNFEYYAENYDITKTILDDIDVWGVGKLKGERNFSQSALTDSSRLFNSTLEGELIL